MLTKVTEYFCLQFNLIVTFLLQQLPQSHLKSFKYFPTTLFFYFTRPLLRHKWHQRSHKQTFANSSQDYFCYFLFSSDSTAPHRTFRTNFHLIKPKVLKQFLFFDFLATCSVGARRESFYFPPWRMSEL